MLLQSTSKTFFFFFLPLPCKPHNIGNSIYVQSCKAGIFFLPGCSYLSTPHICWFPAKKSHGTPWVISRLNSKLLPHRLSGDTVVQHWCCGTETSKSVSWSQVGSVLRNRSIYWTFVLFPLSMDFARKIFIVERIHSVKIHDYFFWVCFLQLLSTSVYVIVHNDQNITVRETS